MATLTPPAGLWPSAITARSLVQESVRLGDPLLAGNDLYWLETRPREKGRCVIVRADADGRSQDVLPAPYSARSRAHEYGGGVYCVHDGSVWFVNNQDQNIHAIHDGSVEAVTTGSGRQFADLCYDARRQRLLAICEQERDNDEPRASLVAIALTGSGRGHVTELAAGADFYSSPAPSPDGKSLAYLSWSHPDMPWDATALHVAPLDDAGRPGAERRLAADRVSRFQPGWGPDGRLYFMADHNGYWNLHVLEDDGARAITREPADLGMAQWVFGMSSWGFVGAGRVAALRHREGLWSLLLIEIDSGAVSEVSPFPFNDCAHLCTGQQEIALLAGAPDRPQGLYRAASGATPVAIRVSTSTAFAAGYISRAEPLQFATTDDATAYGFYFPPANPDQRLAAGERPPLVVTCHGGPTAAASPGLDPRRLFWTSRGYAVADINYRGSTGYGRAYRKALQGRWGIADWQDCVAAVDHLVKTGRADPDRVFISGGSAGGYTVLCALTFSDTFTAGASYYGIGDLRSLAEDTHKFESRYLDGLLGVDTSEPGASDAVFAARSPVAHADQLSSPVIFFQGLDDKVVPPNQAQKMVDALRARNITVEYLTFADEGHGFRSADTIVRCLESQLEFFTRVGSGKTRGH